jgi:hypothetical protein
MIAHFIAHTKKKTTLLHFNMQAKKIKKVYIPYLLIYDVYPLTWVII